MTTLQDLTDLLEVQLEVGPDHRAHREHLGGRSRPVDRRA